MDGLIALGVLALIALPVMAVGGFFMALGARRRIALLERRLARLESGQAPIPYADLAEQLRTASTAGEPVVPTEEPAETPAPAEAAPEELVAAAPAPEDDPEAVRSGPAAEPPAETPPVRPARPKETLEQKLGARWAVWVGGLALALGAIFLVRYSIDAGLIGPGVRIAFGALFSVLLLGAGDRLRRSPRVTAFSAIPSANIPGILTAAGTVGLFATVYSAYALYGMIGPTAAFLLLAAISLGTMAAAALHGPWLSGLGLVGAFAAPLLIDSPNADPRTLMVYLVFVTAAAFGLARLRLWRWLAIAAATGAIAWGFVLFASSAGPLSNAIYALALLVLAFLVVDVHRESPLEGRPDRLAVIVLWAVAALLLTGAAASTFDTVSIVAGLAGAALLLLVVLRFDPLALVAPGVALFFVLLLYGWPAATQAAAEPTTYIVDALTTWFPLPNAIQFFAAVAALGAAALIGTAVLRLERAPSPLPFPATSVAGAAAAGPLLIAIVAYVRITGFVTSYGFAAVALLLAALYAALTARFARREDAERPADAIPTGLFAAASIGGVALCLTMALDGGMLTTAFALAALGAAWVQLRRPIAVLRYGVAALALIVLARIAWDPYIFGARTGGGLYLSILIGYGLPALCFAVASVLLGRSRLDRAVYCAEAAAVVLAALLVVFEIRALVFGGDLLRADTALAEQGLNAAAAFAFALGLARLSRARPSPVFAIGGLIARALGLVIAVIGLGIVVNPLVTGDPVGGGPVLNEILLAYALPAILAALVAAQTPAGTMRFARWLRLATGLVALALAFAAISLEIRFLFAESPDLSFGDIGSAESYTYSAAWLVFGLLLLGFGLVFDQKAARLASAALILVTVLKVFLIDMANLEGVWRALSFIGLGLVLIGIGLLYQKLLFGRSASESEPSARSEPG